MGPCAPILETERTVSSSRKYTTSSFATTSTRGAIFATILSAAPASSDSKLALISSRLLLWPRSLFLYVSSTRSWSSPSDHFPLLWRRRRNSLGASVQAKYVSKVSHHSL